MRRAQPGRVRCASVFGARLYIQISDKRLKLSSPQINRSYESTLSVTIEDGTVRIQLRLLATAGVVTAIGFIANATGSIFAQGWTPELQKLVGGRQDAAGLLKAVQTQYETELNR